MNTQPARYFILAGTRKSGFSFIERNDQDMDRAATIRDLIEQQVDDPVSIFCAEDGRWNDCTASIAVEIADIASSQRLCLGQPVLEFISEHVGLMSAYALGMEAA